MSLSCVGPWAGIVSHPVQGCGGAGLARAQPVPPWGLLPSTGGFVALGKDHHDSCCLMYDCRCRRAQQYAGHAQVWAYPSPFCVLPTSCAEFPFYFSPPNAARHSVPAGGLQRMGNEDVFCINSLCFLVTDVTLCLTRRAVVRALSEWSWHRGRATGRCLVRGAPIPQ